MAIDTRDKRMSMLGLAQAMVRLLVNPIGAIGRPGRQLLEFLYGGIPLADPAVATPRTLGYRAARDTTIARAATLGTTIALTARRDTTITLWASET